MRGASDKSGRRRGFSLIEMLVSSAVVGVLVSMLLPAVQNAREAARRASCANNLRQIGIALHGYHETNGTFPIGARSQRGVGPSWMVGLLPYFQQDQIYHQFDMNSSSNGLPSLPPPFGSTNGARLSGISFDVLRCPSSPLPRMQVNFSIRHQAPSYVGISGSSSDNGFPAKRVSQCCVADGMQGHLSADGVLVPNAAVQNSDVSDGLSHTLVVGEASNYSYHSNGNACRTDPSYPNSWITGTSGNGTPPYYEGSVPLIARPPAWNLTTLRYPPNSKYNQPGVHENHGPNNPLSSAHAAGVQTLLLDGSVHFLSDSIYMDTLYQMGMRDDGLPCPEF